MSDVARVVMRAKTWCYMNLAVGVAVFVRSWSPTASLLHITLMPANTTMIDYFYL